MGRGLLDDSPAEPIPIQTSPCALNGKQILAHDAFRAEALGNLGWYAVATELRGQDVVDLLDRLAVEFGTAGASQRDRRQHRMEREQFEGRSNAW